MDSNLPLGITTDVAYAEVSLDLDGQTLTFLSDGVVGVTSTDGELFGFDRARRISRKSAKEIAAGFQLSVKTVEAHKFNLMRKLDIHNKAQLVQYAIQKKIIRLPELAVA